MVLGRGPSLIQHLLELGVIVNGSAYKCAVPVEVGEQMQNPSTIVVSLDLVLGSADSVCLLGLGSQLRSCLPRFSQTLTNLAA